MIDKQKVKKEFLNMYQRDDDSIVDFFLSLIEKHEKELVKRIKGLQKKRNISPDYENGYNNALADILSIITNKE